MRKTDWARVAVLLGGTAMMAACGGGGDAGDASTMEDGSTTPRDGAPDGGCAADGDCDDGLYCNGVETCDPTADAADERGCVAGSPPCAEGEVCDEEAGSCTVPCADEDGDGHGRLECGGDDCDDTDPDRFPGNAELCDGMAHDEDCNPDTFGFVDADEDGSASNVCCNVLEDGTLNCGGDCNDADSTVHPRAGDGPPLYCDGTDNDCDGVPDEGCPCTEGESRDCGTEAQLMRIGTCEPGTQICSGGTWTESCSGGRAPDEELCDGADNDCDGTVDEAVKRTYYRDEDGDGFGVTTDTTLACSPPDGWTRSPGDCDDTKVTVNPLSAEICNGVDDDCDMMIDEGATSTFHRDADGDGFGTATDTIEACAAPSGYVADATDCDDTRRTVNPPAAEVCDGIDNNCDESIDLGCACTEGDTQECGTTEVGACSLGTQRCVGGTWAECVGAIEPATETCDGVDEDCDGTIDNGVGRTYYVDDDGDGFGTDTTTVVACSAPGGYSSLSTDCDDTTRAVNPAAAERCNGIDDDCDTLVDPGCSCTTGETRGCGEPDGSGGILTTGQCAEGTQRCIDGVWGECVAAVTPSTETCNGLDDDCDGAADEGVTRTFYGDGDGDGFGLATDETEACSAPAGYVASSSDCDDTDAAVSPAATELCNGVDDNCTMGIDEGCDCTSGETTTCGPSDGSGGILTTGECSAGTQRCIDGLWGECVGSVSPRSELCNGEDDDCDGSTDEGTTASCYSDGDGDGYGIGSLRTVCADSGGGCPTGFSSTAGDCDDGATTVHPAATESCNGLDDDCDGATDEGTTITCYGDADGDGYGAGVARELCPESGGCPSSYSELGGDCNDSDAAVSPGATESCNARDDDCDGTADDGFGCVRSSERSCTTGCGTAGIERCALDCSGYGVCRADVETCNGCDDDADGAVDESFQCEAGSTGNPCVTGCGTVGTYECSAGCTPGACTAATETCNGCDDTGEGSIDESFACAVGESQSCTTSCGTAGSQSCYGDCSGFRACRASSETCNGCDDDLNGAVDDGFECRQGEVLGCTTACRTAGTRVCQNDCTIPSSCYASGETCNYCDDNGTGGLSDEESLASSTEQKHFASCGDLTTSGVASCSIGSTRDTATVLDGTDSASGAAAFDGTLQIGYGPVEIWARVNSSLGDSTYPADCWALAIYKGLQADIIGGGGPNCGVEHGRTGYAVEWMFYSDSFGDFNQSDRVRLRPLDGGSRNSLICTSLGTVCDFAVPSSEHLDRGETGSVSQWIKVEIHPDIPGTSEHEDYVKIYDRNGSLVHRCYGGPPLLPQCPVVFEPGDTLQLAITGGSGGANAVVQATSSSSPLIFGGGLRGRSSETCP